MLPSLCFSYNLFVWGLPSHRSSFPLFFSILFYPRSSLSIPLRTNLKVLSTAIAKLFAAIGRVIPTAGPDLFFIDCYLFHSTNKKGAVSNKPFIGSAIANRLSLHLATLRIHNREFKFYDGEGRRKRHLKI